MIPKSLNSKNCNMGIHQNVFSLSAFHGSILFHLHTMYVSMHPNGYHACTLNAYGAWLLQFLNQYFDVNAHYFGGCPLIHKYWSKTLNFICNQVLKENSYSLAILMHAEMFLKLKKSCSEVLLQLNKLSFKMQKLITNFCYNNFY